MAVAAYASLLSLSHVLENIQHPARRTRLHLDSNQVQTLHQKVQFLLEFLEVDSGRISQETEDLARQIAILADEAEDVIDLHVVYQLGEGSRDKSQDMAALSSSYQDIHKVIQKIDSIMNELGMIRKESTDVSKQQPVVSVPDSSSTAFTSSGKSSTIVGFDEHLVRVMNELTGYERDLQIIPIIGMGGIEINVSLNITFPTSLKKLTLSNCCIPWEEMTVFGSVLPNLEKLKLYHSACKGSEWSPVEGQFPRLKVLIIWNNILVRWRAESIHFPNLERLHLSSMQCLEEIPSGIGDIPTLLSIDLYDCSDSCVNSAKQILEEQQSFGNETLQLYVG
ncbi:uncharacterized protein LOC105157233 [Sesamum indicum]|uniref:Uncharacterized protein LOC105157233 n=1 Tax=Sesamum indicum TaxID=4182 RepID=A0A6I9SP30_SESIN|nr:uncharacterized protein LOC105157233 [Sesamum indicum]